MNSINSWWFGVAIGATAGGLLIGIVLKKFVAGPSGLCAKMVCGVARFRRREEIECLCEPHHAAAGDVADNALVLAEIPREDIIETCDDRKSLELYHHYNYPREDDDNDMLCIDYQYDFFENREDGVFPTQRKVALKDLCNKFENTIYLMIFIVLFFHLIAEKEEEDEPVELTRWESILESLKWLGRAVLRKFGYFTEALIF